MAAEAAAARTRKLRREMTEEDMRGKGSTGSVLDGKVRRTLQWELHLTASLDGRGGNRPAEATGKVCRRCCDQKGKCLRVMMLAWCVSFCKSGGNGDQASDGVCCAARSSRRGKGTDEAAHQATHGGDNAGEHDKAKSIAVPGAVVVGNFKKPREVKPEREKRPEESGDGSTSDAHDCSVR